jgi:hypothetical protein
MKIEVNKTRDEQEHTAVASRLPELTGEWLEMAQSNLDWARSYAKVELGRVYHEEFGISLQLVTKDTVRCLSVGDHPHCYTILSGMLHSFELADMELQLDPFTIERSPSPKPTESLQSSIPGMEVA